MSDELGILNNGQYHKVSGERFIVSDIVNSDLEFNLGLTSSQLFFRTVRHCLNSIICKQANCLV